MWFILVVNVLQKSQVEETSSSDSDDDDIDRDFNALEMYFPKLCNIVTNEKPATVADNIVPEILNLSLLSQLPGTINY